MAAVHCCLSVTATATPIPQDPSTNASPSSENLRPTKILLPNKKPQKWSTGMAPGEWGGPPTTSKLRKYWGGQEEDPITSDDYIWNKDFMGRMKKQLDNPNDDKVLSGNPKEVSSGFLSFNRVMTLDSLEVDLGKELSATSAKPLVEEQAQETQASDYPTRKWRPAPTRREQEKWDRATKAATGGTDVMLRESRRPEGDPEILAAQSREQYFKLKDRLQLLTLGIGGIGVVSAYISYSPEISVSYGAGLFFFVLCVFTEQPKYHLPFTVSVYLLLLPGAMTITTDVFTSRIPSLLSPKAPEKLATKLYSISCSPPPPVSFFSINGRSLSICRKMMLTAASASASGTPGLYSSEQYELTAENVDMVLEAVRPYLIADGGNVDVVSVDDGVVSLKLQGACESCPSSTTTMTMGIEKILKEKFGAALKDICQVYDEPISNITVEAINRHLDILRPAIKNYGGIVDVLSVEGDQCLVKYIGPESIGSGIKAAIKEKFPGIINVVFTD